jgi:hypothetical protein
MFGDYPLNIDVLLLTISMFGDYPLNIDVLLLTISMFGDYPLNIVAKGHQYLADNHQTWK